jgi:NADPH:quinone reductase-like Zn-dependent oxidoreductase
VHAACITVLGSDVTTLELNDPRDLRDDEVLIAVKAAGVGNWDDITRRGGWDLGLTAPAALGVQAAGFVHAVGGQVRTLAVADEVLTFTAPLRDQGAWAAYFIAKAADVSRKPAALSWAVAGALPVPGLTARQALSGALQLNADDTVLIHGASGVTGRLLVQLAAHLGAQVVATSRPGYANALKALGANIVLNTEASDWTHQARQLRNGHGVTAAVNAIPGAAHVVLPLVGEGGRLATLTSDPPAPERGVSVTSILVSPDGHALEELAQLAAHGDLTINVAASYPLRSSAQALAHVVTGTHGGAVVLTP